MAFSLLVSTSAGAAAGGGTFSTGAIDTSGANLIVLVLSYYNGITNPAVLSDSKSNSFFAADASTTATNYICQIAYVYAPTVGSGHTFTLTGASTFGALCVAAFSGSASSPLDKVNHNNGGTTVSTQNTGSVSPAENDELLVAGDILVDGGTTSSIDSSFTLQEVQAVVAGAHQGGALAYKIQTSAGAENPTFSFSAGTRAGTVISTYKAAVASASRHGLPYLGAG